MIWAILFKVVLACEEFFEEHPNFKELGLYPEVVKGSCLLHLAKEGKWALLEYLLDNPSKDEDISEVLDLLTKQKKTLSRISSLLQLSSTIQESNCSFRWAQSLSDLYIEFRFSHRIDTAGCTEIHNLSYSITNTTLNLSGKCLLSGHKILFSSAITFLKPVLNQTAEVNKDLPGWISFKLSKKISPDVWKTIYSGTKPNGMSLWHDMQDSFQGSIDKYKKKKGEL